MIEAVNRSCFLIVSSLYSKRFKNKRINKMILTKLKIKNMIINAANGAKLPNIEVELLLT